MKSLLIGINERFDSELSARFPAGAYLGLAPDGDSDDSVCVLTPVSSVPTFNTGDCYFERINLQFTVYSLDGDFTIDALADIVAAFSTKFDIGDDRLIQSTRTSGPLARKEDQRWWRGDVEYQFLVER